MASARLTAALNSLASSLASLAQAIRDPQVENNDDAIAEQLEGFADNIRSLTAEEQSMDQGNANPAATTTADSGLGASGVAGMNPNPTDPGAPGTGLAATESLDGSNPGGTTGGHAGTTEPEPPTDAEGDAISQAHEDAITDEGEGAESNPELEGVDPEFVDNSDDDDGEDTAEG